MPLEYEILSRFDAKEVWTRIAPFPQRLKDNQPHHWRFHVEGQPKIFLVDHFLVEGKSSPANNYSQDDIQSTTGMTAWIRTFGDVIISQHNDVITAKVILKMPPA